MKMLMLKFMVLISSMIPFIKNPMPMGLILLIQTMISIMYINYINLFSWFSMITFLMMIGGLLILIMYMNSIASNEKFKMNINYSLMMIMLLMLTDELLNENSINENMNLIKEESLSISLMKIFNMKSMYITLMLVLYLLISMISVSAIVKLNEGPLRKFNYE